MPRLMNEAGWASDHPLAVYCDNHSAVKWLSTQQTISTRAIHIDIYIHFINELVSNGKLQIAYISFEENDDDLFTKPLAKINLNPILTRVGVQNIEKKCQESGQRIFTST